MHLLINGRSQTTLELEASAFAEWQAVDFAYPPRDDVQTVRLLVGNDDLGLPSMTPFDPTWRWVWQPRGIAGTVHGSIQITFQDGRYEQHDFQIQLRPRLLDQTTWHELIRDLARLGRNLATALGGSAFQTATIMPLTADSTALEDVFSLLQRHVVALEQACRQIFARPFSELRPQPRRVPFGAIQTTLQPTNELMRDIEPLDDPATPTLERVRDQLGGVPQTITTRQAQSDANIAEHRWLVGLIELVERRLRRVRHLVEEELQRQARPRLEQLSNQIERALQRLRTLRNEPLLQGVTPRRTPPQSQRLIRDAKYRRLVRIWRELRQTVNLTLEISSLALPIHDLPTLYEQWCALIVAHLLAQHGSIIQQSLLNEDVERERWTLALNTTTPLLEIRHHDALYRLHYQPRYGVRPNADGLQSLDGYVRIPDLVLERIVGDQHELLVLDAKYRRASDGRVPQDALDDAYAYQGSIGRDGVSQVAHAAILYPANDQASDFGKVSTCPALPNHLDAVRGVIAGFVRVRVDGRCNSSIG